ncbi:metal-binding protein [Deinococcus sp.]|uniref:metal-binding protein n=1 Tax=Deinococcus sp. TaxID=47478 RepID=UPI003C7A31E0
MNGAAQATPTPAGSRHNTRVPSGRIHNLINVAVYAGLSAAALFLTRTQGVTITPVQALAFSVGYGVGTFLLSPDLDLAEGHVDSKRRWGPLGFLWAPYGMVFSHRGLSHTWILGPLTRLLYLALMALLVWGLAQAVVPHGPLPDWFLSPPPLTHQVLSFKVVYPLLGGYYLSQWLHLIADGIRPDHGLRRGGRKLRGVARRLR